jgi:hypothetical protein
MSRLAANVVAFLAPNFTGYANERTLRTALAKFEAAIDAHGLRGNLDVVTLPSGRLQPVLVFGAREQVPTEAIMLAHAGIPLYQHRSDGQLRGANV